MTAIAALIAMDGTARASPLATPPGRGDSGLEIAPADIDKDPESTGHDGSAPVATITIPEAVTPHGYDIGTATYSVPAKTVSIQPEDNSPVANSTSTNKVTASPNETDQPMPIGPIVDPFGHANPDLTTETIPVITGSLVPLDDFRVGPQIAPTRADPDIAKETVSPSPLPDVHVGPMVIPDGEGGNDGRQVLDNDRGVTPMPSGVPKETEDS